MALREAGAMWDAAEPHVHRFLLKVILTIGALAAAPFLALAIVLVLLGKPWLWAAIAAACGGLLLLAALVLFLVVRSRLRDARGHLELASKAEDWLRSR